MNYHTGDLLRTPRQWIERRLEQVAPGLSKSAIARLNAEKESLPTADSIQLNCAVQISYSSNELNRIAKTLGTPGDNLLRLVQDDLRDGIAVQTTTWTTTEGKQKVCMFGARWRLVLRPQRAEGTPYPLAMLENIQKIEIPTKQARFRPREVRFHPVRDKQPCDLEQLQREYRTCKLSLVDSQDQARALWQRIDETHERRKDAFRQVSRELQKGQTDSTIQARSDIHAVVRRQYSALRVMMDLLQVRSDQEKNSFTAVVLESDALSDSELLGNFDIPPQGGEEFETKCLRLQLHDHPATGVLVEETLIELRHSPDTRSRRARVVSVTAKGGTPVVELDVDAGFLLPGEEVVIETVAKFGMWAHQRAIHDFLNEQAQGYWPDLAHLLCSPAQLQCDEQHRPPERFFCDVDTGAPSLNDRQRMAVAGALATPHAFCIQGPPGTGKTTVICELVQQLIARGERILLVAPTHVAVDEVLRRIGSRPMVRALRLSWDDSRIAEDVRMFTPTNIIEPFIERVQNPDKSKVVPWQKERGSIGEALVMLLALQELQQKRTALKEGRQNADRKLASARAALAAEHSGLESRLEQLHRQLQTQDAEINNLQDKLRGAETAFQASSSKANWVGKALGLLRLGEVGKTRRQRNSLAKQRLKNEKSRDDVLRNRQAAADRLDCLKTSVADAEIKATDAGTLLAEAVENELAATERCNRHEMLRADMSSADALTTLLGELRDRDNRLDGYQRLNERFDKMVAEVCEEGEDLDGLRRDLLAITNLFCCTTTGVASSKALKELVFDTLIVDEASRVTDAEFLIGATRAKRWILVGDEHQLPPYVEQNDEHFIHALSALHQSESIKIDLDQAVDELGVLWEEDEELHQFRRANVLSFAVRLRDSGHWESNYRDAYQSGIKYLRNEVRDPSRSLLKAMRDNLIHSLFERVVESCSPAMRVRLVEQRRMIEPLASIVSKPVYGGDYLTPSSEELARCDVVALTTSSFPTPITFLDTSLYRKAARDELRGNSFVNPFEADWIVQACKTLDQELSLAGSRKVTVSILSFYKAQAKIIRERLDKQFGMGGKRLECLRFSVIDAIDRIQGQESDIVILSFCRTAGKHVNPGFGQWLQDLRRLNVACTRAHRALIFVGQKELLGKLCSNEQAAQFYRHLNDLFNLRPEVMRVVNQFGNRSA